MAGYLAANLAVGCYPDRVPQGITDYPVLAYTLVDGDSLLDLSGPSGQAWREYQFDAYSADYAQAGALDESLRKLLQGLCLAAGPMGLIPVLEANKHRPSTFYAPAVDGSDDGIYRYMSEYTIWYLEP
jgi:hypothetical protein